MKVILQFFLLFSVILNFETWAQAPQYCGFDLMLNSLDDKYPGLRQACNAQYKTTVQQALSTRGTKHCLRNSSRVSCCLQNSAKCGR